MGDTSQTKDGRPPRRRPLSGMVDRDGRPTPLAAATIADWLDENGQPVRAEFFRLLWETGKVGDLRPKKTAGGHVPVLVAAGNAAHQAAVQWTVGRD